MRGRKKKKRQVVQEVASSSATIASDSTPGDTMSNEGRSHASSPSTTPRVSGDPNLPPQSEYAYRVLCGSDIIQCIDAQNARTRREVGDRVMIDDGDRGIDMGTIQAVEIVPVRCATALAPERPRRPAAARILRRARDDEVRLYELDIREDERHALETAAPLVHTFSSGKMKLHRAIFRYDKSKLTLYYSTSERLYFVSLLRQLYSRFKCRVWLKRVREDGISDVSFDEVTGENAEE